MNGYPQAVRRFGEVMQEMRAADRPAERPANRAVAAPARQPTVVRLWLPLTLLFLLLAPFALVLSPLLYFVPRPWRLSPVATVLAVGAFLLALGGTDIDVRTHDAIVRLKIV
jgi:hypothetical protein